MNHPVRTILVLISAASLMISASCRREEQVQSPVIRATLTPEKGSTTQKFIFDLSGSESRSGRGEKIFSRWDWDGDGTWDTPFTRMMVYEHRYFIPGTWYTQLEMMNLEGGTDTIGFEIEVSLGHSAPRAMLKIIPAGGHFLMDYLLDASGTRDDEDSLSSLKFRWDFDGDGNWDTSFTDPSRMVRRYTVPGFYQPVVWVTDPGGLSSKSVGSLRVTQEDPLIRADFSWSPDPVIALSDIRFDAGSSTDAGNPGKPLRYRWDWENDGMFDTDWLNDAATIASFRYETLYAVRLQVMNERGLMNDTVKAFWAKHKNQPPRAHFSVSTIGGNTRTVFRFNSWSSRDPESGPSELACRWDFDGDGFWDTEPSFEKVVNHTFTQTGAYDVTLETTDNGGLKDAWSLRVYVGPGDYETGVIEDRRGTSWEHYGTVRIVDQWWLSRNICVQDTNLYHQYFYDTDMKNYYVYGNLYASGYYKRTCPAGWRVPTRQDWQLLFSNFDPETLYDDLAPGGRAGFNIILGGMGDTRAGSGLNYTGKDRWGHYWTTTVPLEPAAMSTWIVSFDGVNRKIIQGWWNTQGVLYSVRCVKDD